MKRDCGLKETNRTKSLISESISQKHQETGDTSENGITNTEKRIFILTVNADENNKKIKLQRHNKSGRETKMIQNKDNWCP